MKTTKLFNLTRTTHSKHLEETTRTEERPSKTRTEGKRRKEKVKHKRKHCLIYSQLSCFLLLFFLRISHVSTLIHAEFAYDGLIIEVLAAGDNVNTYVCQCKFVRQPLVYLLVTRTTVFDTKRSVIFLRVYLCVLVLVCSYACVSARAFVCG